MIMVVQITRVFPPVSQVQPALCPGATSFYQLYCSVPVRQCLPVLGTQRVPSVPEAGITRLAPFSRSRVPLSASWGSPLCRLFPPPVQVLSV